jgi:hypothetical protein
MSGTVVLGNAEYNEAKRLKSLLEERGIQIELRSHPENCGSKTCKPTLEVVALEADLPAIQAFLGEQRSKELAGLEFDASLLSEVFDPEKETARCPACGATFETRLGECPDCGLRFAV